MRKKDSYGLVFAGGGGKGAYEIGVWKALKEFKEISVGAVSGTSVGALNAALFACGEYETANRIWMNISQDKILTSKSWNLVDYASILAVLQPGAVTANLTYAGLLRRYFKDQAGMFSRQGLKEIIRQSDAPRKIRSGKIPCYATCYNLDEFRTQYFQLNQLMPKDVETVLLASSALPVIYPMEELNGVRYWDGGLPAVGDNVPVKPLHDGGWRKFIVVHLKRDVEEEGKRYEDSEYIHLYPGQHQGGMLTGTLDFSPEGSARRIRQGYEDTVRQLKLADKIGSRLDQMGHMAGRIKSDSKVFYGVMKEQLPSLEWKEEREGASLSGVEKRMEKIQEDFRRVKDSMGKGILEITSSLSASRAFGDELESRDFLVKVENLFTGNKKRAEINKHQNHSIEVLTKKLYDLVNSDKITIDLVEAFRNECKVYIYQLGKNAKSQGEEIRKLEESLKRFDEGLAETEKRCLELGDDMGKVALALESHVSHTAYMEKGIGERIGRLEKRMDLLQWAETVRVREFHKTEYRNLSVCQKIVCVTSDFFGITGGKWDDHCLLCLKAVLEKLEIDPAELIPVEEFLSLAAFSRECGQYLFERNGMHCYMLGEDHGQMTLDEILMEGIYIGRRMADHGLATENGSEAYLMVRGLDKEFRLTAFQMVCQLLVGMRRVKGEQETENQIVSDIEAEGYGKQKYLEY